MPLTSSGDKVLTKLQSEYGDKSGKGAFYAMINSGRLPKGKMEGRSAGRKSGRTPKR